MAKYSSSPEHDQHDPKAFKETLGSFGTTTVPGENQLTALQTKVRQGIKHVELHLSGTGKGQFNTQDVPDKYGFEQRRTIMQLAKLNQQTLSVHGSFDVVSFSGMAERGFDESRRLNSMKEIDETIKFAAETAKSGAVVFHLQGDNLSTDRGELNLSKSYLNWLEKKAKKDPKYKKELEDLKKDYFNSNYLKRKFVDNPEKEIEVKEEFNDLKRDDIKKYEDIAKTKNEGREAWEYYYMDTYIDKLKLSPAMNPLIKVGDQIDQVQRQQEFVDVDLFKNDSFTEGEKRVLKIMGVDTGKTFSVEDFQRANAIFTNGFPDEFRGRFTSEEYNSLKNKVFLEYGKVLERNNYLQGQADKEFYEKFTNNTIEGMRLQREDLKVKYQMHKEAIDRIRDLEDMNKRYILKIREFEGGKSDLDKAAMDAIKQDVSERNREIQNLQYQEIGINEYQQLARYHETIAQINRQISELEKRQKNVTALTDDIFDKNTSSMGHLGLKALRYQLDLINKAEQSDDKLRDYNKKLNDLEKRYSSASSSEEKERLSEQIQKVKYDRRVWVGLKDYYDPNDPNNPDNIDIINKPLYLAPENMLPGYGSLTSLEEYKATIRLSQEEFAKRILSKESEYKKLKEDYEKHTGKKITTHEQALEIAKRHIGGTFDNAHAGVWLKHFRKLDGESEEHRIERFNQWLNGQAEEMAKEGIIKHIHFNDTQAKDDDHNLLGSGILDIFDLRERLRKAGIKEPLIVEAGGRGGNNIMHILNAFEIFNPNLRKDPGIGDNGYNANFNGEGERQEGSFGSGANVSDWMSVQRVYDTRPQVSNYGMSYNTFRHQPPQNPDQRGVWSGTSFF